MVVTKLSNKGEIKRYLSEYVGSLALQSIQDHGSFTIALSGGSLPEMLEDLASQDLNWENWKVFFADERCVDLDHPDSNYRACNSFFLSKTNIPRENIITITSVEDPDEAATQYEAGIHQHVPSGSFDLILLGLGPDGHTASLFPNHNLLSYTGPRLVVPIFDSPKPPSNRITLTLPTLNQAKEVIFVATGASKASTIASVFASYRNPTCPEEAGSPPLPAALVRTYSGSLPQWIMDHDAASLLET